MVIDRKTGNVLHVGSCFRRRHYKGVEYQYEVLEFIGQHSVKVSKTLRGENPVVLEAPLLSLQLDYVASIAT